MPYIMRTIAARVAIEVLDTATKAAMRNALAPNEPRFSFSVAGITPSGSAIPLATSGSDRMSAKSKTNTNKQAPAKAVTIARAGLTREFLVSSANVPAVSNPTNCVITSATTMRNGTM